MSLVVYDAGQRIQTPWYDVFAPRHVEASAQTTHLRAVAETSESEKKRWRQQAPSQRQGAAQEHARSYAEVSERERQPLQVARDIMSSPVHYLSPAMTVEQACEYLARLNIRHLLLCDSLGRVRGLVSERDLLRARLQDPPTALLSQLGSRKLLTVSPDTGLRELAEAMSHYRIGALPVVSEFSDDIRLPQVLGIVTRSDILCSLIHGAPLEAWS